jgi:DNA-binding MarR family transcriptional regulator
MHDRNRRRIGAEATLALNRVIDRVLAFDRAPRDFGGGDRLTLTEIHAINAVKRNPGINITGLAREISLTKGTVSPLVSRLEEKGYLRKRSDAGNRKTVLVEITRKGEAANSGFLEFYIRFTLEQGADITFGQYAVFIEVLAKLEAFLDSLMADGG